MMPGAASHEDDVALAGEYVLGVLDSAERAAVENRMRSDSAFASLVATWERDFAAMNDSYTEEPAPNLLPQIEARLFGRPAPAPALRRLGDWWRWMAAGAAFAAVATVLVLVMLPTVFPPAPVLRATLSAEGQPLTFAARWDGRELIVERASGEAASAGQVHELWLIAGEGQAPVSVGLLEATEVRLRLDAVAAGAVLAVSLEPAGGSPTGAPTGPVLVTGVLAI